MKILKYLSIWGISLLTFFVLQGCYTQLAVSKPIFATDQSVSQSHREDLSQSEVIPDTIQDYEIPPDTIIHEYHYWLHSPYDPWFSYPPYLYDPDFYLGFYFTWGDPYWNPWYYARYRSYWPTYYYPGWCGYDSYWYDPYWGYAYYPGYYPGYWYSRWSWYWPVYGARPTQWKKRNWDRRGADLTNQTIVRPSNSIEDQDLSLVDGPGSHISIKDRSETETRSVQRNEQDIKKPIKRTETKLDIEKNSSREHHTGKKTPRTINRIYHQVERFITQSEHTKSDKQNNSKRSRVSTSKRNNHSSSNNVSTRQVHRSISRSNSQSHGSSHISGTSRSGGSRGGSSSKSRTRG